MQTLQYKNIFKELPPKLDGGTSVALDLELSGLREEQLHRPSGRFVSLACSFDGENAYIIFDDTQVQEFLERLDGATWIFHNATFDISHLKRWAIVNERPIRDTMLIEKLLWSDYYDDFGLNDLVRRYLKLYMPKGVRKEFRDLEGEMTREQIEYAALDVIGTWLADQEQQKIIDHEAKLIWEKVDMPTVWTSVNLSGFTLDKDRWLSLSEHYSSRKEEISEELGKQYGKMEKKFVGRGKAKTEVEEFVPFNPASPLQVLNILKSQGLDIESTGDEVLSPFREENELVAKMLEFRTCAKRATTYGADYLKFVEADSRIYSSLNVSGAACLPAGELVLTSRGYIYVQNVRLGDKVISYKGTEDTVGELRPAHEANILKVRLMSGIELRCSDNHPFLVKRNGYEFPLWVEAKSLDIDDCVYVQSSLQGVERWKKIELWEDFSVSSWGRVRNDKAGGTIQSQYPKGRWGHLKVLLWRDGCQVRGENRKDFPVHRLVAQAFLGNSDLEVCHINGIAWDNSIGNLKYGTTAENRAEAIRHGTALGRNWGNTLLTIEDVENIRSRSRLDISDADLARSLGISRKHVGDIRNGRRWKQYEEIEKRVHFLLEPVVSVIFDGKDLVYGLTVSETSSHVTGGIVTHNTGRMSSNSPNLQQVPKDKEYRECFIAGAGKKLIIADYSSQEPRIFAYLTQDPELIGIFNSGKDIYCEVARFAFGENITKADKERRNQVKALVLGLMYGLSPYGFAAQNEVDIDTAQDDFDRFFAAFPKAAEWVKRQQSFNPGFTKTILGRKCHLHPYNPQWKRNALNNPIQGAASDMLKLAMREFRKVSAENISLEKVGIILPVHDEIILWAIDSVAEEMKELLEEIMISVAEKIHKGIPAAVEAHVASSWAEK